VNERAGIYGWNLVRHNGSLHLMVWVGHKEKIMLVTSIDGGKHILQNDMLKF